MGFFDKLFGRRQKASGARSVLTWHDWGRPVQMPRDYKSFSQEGYQKNVVTFKCVQMIAKSVSQIPWMVFQRDEELEQHPAINLIRRPNPLQGQAAFMEALAAYYCIAGNSYIEAVAPTDDTFPNEGNPPLELYSVRPDLMKVVPGENGFPEAYVFGVDGKRRVYPVDFVNGSSPILHVKQFNPLDPWYGMSPVEAAVYSIDQHNESAKWNFSLLQKSAVPSGVFKIVPTEMNPSGTLTDEQYARVNSMIETNYAGAGNAGKHILLEGGLDWQQTAMSPKDMDWLEGKNTSARDIALAFGVPPILLNIPGDSTFANYKEARMAFYEDTIIPIMSMFRDELNNWLMPFYDDESRLEFDVDKLPALAPKREQLFTMVQGADFLTVNEKRAAGGYEELEGWDVILMSPQNLPINADQGPGLFEGDALFEEPDEPDEEPQDGDQFFVSNDEAEEMASEDEAEVKVFNLINNNERMALWKRNNRLRDRLEFAFEKDVQKELITQAELIAKKVAGADIRVAEFAALEVIYGREEKLADIIRNSIERVADAFGPDVILDAKRQGIVVETKDELSKYEQAIAFWIENRTAESVKLIDGTSEKVARRKIKEFTRRQLDEDDPQNDLAKALFEEFEGLSKSRAQTIARTEVAMASQNAQFEAVKTLNVPGMQKTWISAQDDRVRDVHRAENGQSVDLDDIFVLSDGTKMKAPLDPNGPAKHVINCRCTLSFNRRGE